MADLHMLPEVNIMDDINSFVFNDSSLEKKSTGKNETEEKFPRKVSIKKQRAAVPWHSPEQEFTIVSHEISPDTLELLDKFLNTNLPSDQHKSNAIKFVGDVLLGKTNETNKLFHDGRNAGYLLSFTF